MAALAASVTLASAVAPGGAAKGNGGVVIGCRDALTGSDNQAICVDAFVSQNECSFSGERLG